MKKTILGGVWVAVLLLGVTLAGWPTGQSESAQNKKATQLSLWIFQTEADGWNYFVDEAKAYNDKNPNVTIDLQRVGIDAYLSGVKLTTAFAAAQGPDLFLSNSPQLLKYINAGIAMPLNSYISDKAKSDFYSGALNNVTVNHNVYAIPFEQELVLLYYNADLFVKAGISAPPKTWTELTQDATKLNSDKTAGLIIPVAKDGFQAFVFYPFVWQTGADIVTADGHSGLKDPGVTKALALWRQLTKSGAINLKPPHHASQIDNLVEGAGAMQMTVTYAIPLFDKQFSQYNVKVAPLPVPDEGGKPTTIAGGWNVMVNAQSKNSAAAAKFASWLFASDDGQGAIDYVNKAKYVFPARKSVADALKGYYASDSRGNSNIVLNQVLDTQRAEPRWPAQIPDIVLDMLNQAMYTDTPLNDVVNQANDKLETFLKGYKGAM